MSFEPTPGMHILLGEENIEFTSLEMNKPSSVYVYGEQGKEATVYRVVKNNKFHALKVFRFKYQHRRLINTVKQLNSLKNLDGLATAERIIIDRDTYPDLIKIYPELNFSILMPWIEGRSWGRIIEDNKDMQYEDYLKIAKLLSKVISNLEKYKLAHCDLSHNSFMVDSSFSALQLFDLENMYGHNMPRPVPEVSYGTPGYRPLWIAENGLWDVKGDRFAFAILCAEIITWHNKSIRDNKARIDSFFSEEEIGDTSPRFNFMVYCLSQLSPKLPELFQKAWFSTRLDQCPTISHWKEVIDDL